MGCSSANLTRLVDNLGKSGQMERATHPSAQARRAQNGSN
jgi:hypothetical protein